MAPPINRKKGLYCHETSFSKSAGNFSCAHFLKGPKPRTGTYRAERWKGIWGETNSTSISPTFAATFPLREISVGSERWRICNGEIEVRQNYMLLLGASTQYCAKAPSCPFQFQDVKTASLPVPSINFLDRRENVQDCRNKQILNPA